MVGEPACRRAGVGERRIYMPILGGLAALATAISWSACALFFTSASHRIGSYYMNHYRMLFGTALLVLIVLCIHRSIPLSGISQLNWVLLGTSGFIGYFISDLMLFQCYVDASPRIGALVFNFYPFTSALFAWLILGEVLPLLAWLGMAVTISGIVWVILEKSTARIETHKKHFYRGVALAASASIVQGLSFALAKPAMTGAGSVDPLIAALIRAIFGGSAFWILSFFIGCTRKVLSKASDTISMKRIFYGAIFGPSFGVWVSMIAIKLAPIGIATTVMALMPVTILPMTAIVHKEKISYRAIIGAIVAVLGIAILFNVSYFTKH